MQKFSIYEIAEIINELNIEQTRFINLIKAYIVKNGVIDKRILNEDPFTSYGSILQIFQFAEMFYFFTEKIIPVLCLKHSIDSDIS